MLAFERTFGRDRGLGAVPKGLQSQRRVAGRHQGRLLLGLLDQREREFVRHQRVNSYSYHLGQVRWQSYAGDGKGNWSLTAETDFNQTAGGGAPKPVHPCFH
jgi:hypothetical protein